MQKIKKNGFTFLEITIVVSITLIIALISGDFIISQLRSNKFGYDQSEAISQARKAINILSKEIRESAQGDTGEYLLATTTDFEFSFYSNIDDDINMEKIRYFLDENILKKGITEATGMPLEYLSSNEEIKEIVNYIENQATNSIFTYYDENNNIISDPDADKSDIRLVRILLKINVTPEVLPNDYDVIIDVMIRNLKNNL